MDRVDCRVPRGRLARLASGLGASLLGVMLMAESPAMSLAPGEAAPPAGAAERLRATLSTRAPSEGCSAADEDCTFRPCCDGAGYCRQTGDGERYCR